MKYMGSKARFAKPLLEIMLKDRQDDQYYIEPFCGGCNVIDKVTGPRIANDINSYLIEMWKYLVYKKFIPPDNINRDIYNIIRNDKEKFPKHVVGWVGFNCSYSGKFFGGFAGQVKTKLGTVRDYQKEAVKNVLKQVEKLKGTEFYSGNYWDIKIPNNSIIYCDIPYKGTTKYANEFDHGVFWDWARLISKNNKVYVSEYEAPDDFECVWSKQAKSSLSANGKCGGNKNSTEKLFIYKG
jgi:DNA adenine methylase